MSPPPQAGEGDSLDPLFLRSKADYHYSLAEALSLEGQSQRAIEEFKLVLVYDQGSVPVRLRLSAEYIRQGLLSEAMEQAEEAYKLDSSSEEALLLLGGLYSSLRMYDLALNQYNKVLDLNPERHEVYLYVGALFAEQKKFQQAEATFRELLEKDDYKEPHKAHYFLGRILVEKGGEEALRGAEDAYMRALQAEPRFDEAILALAELYKMQKKEKRAWALLESFQEKFGPNARVAKELSQYYLEKEAYVKAAKQLEYLEGFDPSNLNVKVKLSLILIELKQYDQAANRLEEVLAMAPDSDKIRFYLGAVYEELKEHKRAREHFAKVASSSSYYPDAVIHSAHSLQQAGNLSEAEDLLKSAIEKRQEVVQFYAFYASLLDARKDYKTGVDVLSKAVKQFPKNVQLRFFLGSMHDRLGNRKETVTQMRKAIEVDPNHVQSLNYLAYTFAEMGRHLDEALIMAKKANELQPNDPYILDTLGWVHFKKGDVKQAIQLLEAAYSINSKESIIAEHLGDAYYRFQLIEKARELYKKAVSHEQDDSKIQRIREKIASIENQISEGVREPASEVPSKPSN
jgi:tetratricopeptide (TPR) repeat protein